MVADDEENVGVCLGEELKGAAEDGEVVANIAGYDEGVTAAVGAGAVALQPVGRVGG